LYEICNAKLHVSRAKESISVIKNYEYMME